MERLTNRNIEIKTLRSENEAYWLATYFKLKEYEDAEEQGMLIRLPCKVWGTLYAINTECEADENLSLVCDVNCKNCKHNYQLAVETLNDRSPYFLYSLMMGKLEYYTLGKNIFSTKEEAEKALERMNENA